MKINTYLERQTANAISKEQIRSMHTTVESQFMKLWLKKERRDFMTIETNSMYS